MHKGGQGMSFEQVFSSTKFYKNTLRIFEKNSLSGIYNFSSAAYDIIFYSVKHVEREFFTFSVADGYKTVQNKIKHMITTCKKL